MSPGSPSTVRVNMSGSRMRWRANRSRQRASSRWSGQAASGTPARIVRSIEESWRIARSATSPSVRHHSAIALRVLNRKCGSRWLRTASSWARSASRASASARACSRARPASSSMSRPRPQPPTQNRARETTMLSRPVRRVAPMPSRAGIEDREDGDDGEAGCPIGQEAERAARGEGRHSHGASRANTRHRTTPRGMASGSRERLCWAATSGTLTRTIGISRRGAVTAARVWRSRLTGGDEVEGSESLVGGTMVFGSGSREGAGLSAARRWWWLQGSGGRGGGGRRGVCRRGSSRRCGGGSAGRARRCGCERRPRRARWSMRRPGPGRPGRGR
jgi:hypothetical protein